MNCFNAYDIRGRVPDKLNDDIAYRIGRAYAAFLQPKSVVVGKDVRHSSAALCSALSRGLQDGGADVYDIGLCGTEEIYHATFSSSFDGGIMVTASHNPMDYNGMKLVREGSQPISGDTGLHTIRDMVAAGSFPLPERTGQHHQLQNKAGYVEHLLRYIDSTSLKPLKIVVNAGNGCAGPIIDLLEKQLPFEFIKVHHQPDGSFPHGIPNPLLPENREATAQAVRETSADLGIAWDGDFDRCFLFDANGRFIEGYYLVGLLAEVMLAKHPGAKIIHDPRLTWNTIEQVQQAGGIPIQSKTGHAFIKERMRAEDAVYGGEMSAHHYFRDFAYCDSGMIPWLLISELISRTGKTLADLVDQRMAAYPCSGELNFQVANQQRVVDRVLNYFAADSPQLDRTDGISLDFAGWRLNLRGSNTEPLLRLNIETRADHALLAEKTTLLQNLITTEN